MDIQNITKYNYNRTKKKNKGKEYNIFNTKKVITRYLNKYKTKT